MRTKEIEQAVKDLGGELLQIDYDHNCFYGMFGDLNYVKWDEMGRAYVFSIMEGQEDCVSEYNLAYLPYERDSKFDVII